MSRLPSASWWTLIAVLSALLGLAATWPLVLHLPTHLGQTAAHPDLQCALWWFPHVAESLAALRTPFFAPDLNWPDGQDVRLLTWNALLQALYAPLSLAVADPVLRLNLALLLTVALNGLGCAWLAGCAVPAEHRRWAQLAGAVVGATAHYAIVEAGAGRFEQALVAPLAVALGCVLIVLGGDRRAAPVVGGALALAATAGMYWFHGYFMAIVLGLWLWGRVLSGRLDRDLGLRLGLLGAGALVLALPLAWPVISALLDPSGFFGQMATEVPDPTALHVRASVPLWTGLAGGLVQSGDPSLQLPLLAMPLCLGLCVVGRGEVRELGALGLVAAVLSLGPVLVGAAGPVDGGRYRLPGTLLNLLPGYERLWWPYRWQAVLLPVAAAAAGVLVVRLPRSALRVAAVVVCGAVGLADTASLLRGGLGEAGARPWPVAFDWPPGLASLRGLDSPAPIMVLPQARAVVVGLAEWTGQPLDTGLGFERDSVRPAAYDARTRLPLWSAVAQAQAMVMGQAPPGSSLPETPTSWTSDQAGGMHYVVYVPGPRDGAVLAPLDAVLGPPFACSEAGVVWAVPGVGEVPAEHADVVARTRSGGPHACDLPLAPGP